MQNECCQQEVDRKADTSAEKKQLNENCIVVFVFIDEKVKRFLPLDICMNI